MKVTRRPKLSLEYLEARECPVAKVILTGSTLLIEGPVTSNSTTGLHVTLTANNQMTVTDNGQMLGKYDASNLYINAISHFNSPITIDLGGTNTTGGYTLGGNIFVNLGEGDNSGDIENEFGVYNGKLGGNLTVVGGSGNDGVIVGYDPRMPPGVGPIPANATTIGGNVLFAARSSTNVISGGGDLFDTGYGYDFVGDGAVSPVVNILGSVTTNAVNAVTLAVNTTVGKDLSVTDTTEDLNTTVFMLENGKVNGNFTFNGEPENNDTSFNHVGQEVIVGPTAVIGGNLSATVGVTTPSNAAFAGPFVSQGIYLQNGSTVNGNVNASVGNGTVDLSSNINGNAVVQIGDAGGTFEFDNGGTGSAPTIAGNLYFFGGNGVNATNGALTGNVSGNAYVSLGNGANPTWQFGDGTAGDGAVGGTLNWTSGNGPDSLTIGSPNLYQLNVHFGNNNDVFSGSTGAILSGSVNGGGRFGAPGNVFNQDGALLVSNFILSNFP